MRIDSEFDEGEAGASARREYERRRENRERRIRTRFGKLGGIAVALDREPQHQRAWADGADGEAAVAASLAKRCHDGVFLLHDRRVPRSRANIDHIAVTPSGVWVIDAKRREGKVEVRRPLFGAPKLVIRGRDQSKLADGLQRQVDLASSTARRSPNGSTRRVRSVVTTRS